MAAQKTRAPKIMRQLIACVILFVLVLAGRGLELGPVSQLSEFVSQSVQTDAEFQAVFAQVGEAVSRKAPAVEAFLPWSQERNETGEETEQQPDQDKEGTDGQNA